MSDEDKKTIYDDFKDVVNMTVSELEKWLKTDDAKSVGIDQSGEKKTDTGGSKSVGYESGERIIKILGTNKADLKDGDYDHMKKVHAYVKRHLAQKPTRKI